MLDVSAFLLDDALKPATPLTNTLKSFKNNDAFTN